MSSHPFCHVCGRVITDELVYAQKGEWSYLQCSACGLVLLHPVPDQEMLGSYYNDSYEVKFDDYIKGVRRRSPKTLDELKKYFPSRGRLLEVGCSYGGFLDEARRDGWEVTGIELSETAARHARDQLGLKVFSGRLDNQLEQLTEPFDVLALFHVIEHVPDPVQLLEQCRRLTKHNGLLILKTPNVASFIARITGSTWQWVSPPAHLYLYSPKTLDALLQKVGYQPLTFWSSQGDAHGNLFEIVCSVVKRALSRSPSPEESISHLRETPYMRIVEAACDVFYYPFRVLIDPLLGAKRRQPELYAVAVNSG